MCIQQHRSYSFLFATERGPEFPALLVEDWSQNEKTLKRFHLFGMTARPPFYPPLRPVGWDIGEDVIYTIREFPSQSEPPQPRILRFPFDALVERGEFFDPLDRERVPTERASPKGWRAPHYVEIAPLQSEVLKTPRLGTEATMAATSALHFDVFVLDDKRLELYATAGCKLQRWLFDGTDWRFQKDYAVEINGPFLVCDKGNAAVAECGGHWCLIEPLEADKPAAHPIVPKIEGEPLLLIEDRVTGQIYFKQQNTIYDDSGRAIRTLPQVTDTPAMVAAISDFVRSLRPE
jgi:hypothetical protein